MIQELLPQAERIAAVLKARAETISVAVDVAAASVAIRFVYFCESLNIKNRTLLLDNWIRER